MNKFSKVALLFLGVIFSLSSCVDSDIDFGLDYIPDNQQSVLGSVTMTLENSVDIKTYLVREEALPSTALGTAILGTYSDNTFGEVSAQTFTQFVPDYLYDDDIDDDLSNYSEFLSLQIYFAFADKLVPDGDEAKEQTFYVYDATPDIIDEDSTYCTNFNPIEMGMIASDQLPVMQFTITSETNKYVDMEAYPGNEAAFDTFIELMMWADKDQYDTEDEYISCFGGFYIKPADDVTMLFTSSLSNVSMVLALRDPADPTDEDDEDVDIYLPFYFDDDAEYETTSVVMIQRDYSSLSYANDIYVYDYEYYDSGDDDADDTVDVEVPTTSPVTSTGIVQTLNGVTTMLYFTDVFVSNLEALKTKDGITYNSIVFNKAEITFDLTTEVDEAPNRLGMFYDYQKAIGMPDYLYEYEQAGYTINYGGYLYRSLKKYIMDISCYVSQLLTDPDDTYRLVNLTPDISYTYTLGQAELDVANIQLNLLYTLVP